MAKDIALLVAELTALRQDLQAAQGQVVAESNRAQQANAVLQEKTALRNQKQAEILAKFRELEGELGL